ncbi:hypothetical protein GW17_00053362, partial [Ensete ventricosum]
MHSLRFPNSGIRAKVFMRKIGFKLLVMRLNRVEWFYTFLLHFRSEGNEEEGRPTTASPPCRTGRPRPSRSQGPLQGGGGRPAAARASPQGAVAARRGGTYGQKRCPRAQPLATRRPQGGPPTGRQQGATACRGDSAGRSLAERLLVGKGRRRLRKGNDDGGGAKFARG